MSQKRQSSGASGEIDPNFWGRTDQIRLQTGAAKVENFTVMKSGGWQNRPGTMYQGTLLKSNAIVRTRTWRFSDAQTYNVEFSNLKASFWLNGSPILEASKNITAATKASPCVLTVTSHGFSAGDKVYVSGASGMTELNGRYFIVGSPTTHTFTLLWSGDGTAYGTALDSTAFGTWTSGGTVERVYSITTPYPTADLMALQFAQSAEVMVIFHPSYAPRKLTRTAHTSWTLAVPTYGPSTAYPTGGSGSGSGSSTTTRYMVIAQNEATGIQSLSGTAHTKTVDQITQANPGVVRTTANHNYATGDEVVFETVSTMSELSNRRFKIEVTDATHFRLVGENTTSYTAFSGTSSVYLAHINVTADAPSASTPITVTLNAAAVAGVRYTVFKEFGGIYGFLGSTYGLTFVDNGITPDTLQSVPIYREPFQGSSNYPSCGAFYQQRLIMGGSANLPNGADCSVVGDFFNFTIHSPSEDSDAVRFTTAGYVDQIRSMAPLDKLVCFTSGAEFVVAGGGEGATLTPTETNARPRTYNGSGSLFPLLIDSNIIYRPGAGQAVFDFHYSFNTDEQGGYMAADRMTFSSHMLKGHTIVDWAYQRAPDSTIWMVREDGVLLSMTYYPGQQLFGPARQVFYNGAVENVTVVREGSDEDAEDVLYLVVARELEDGSTTRYMERLASRLYTDVEDAVFMDSTLGYDGTGSGTATLSGSGWTNETSLTLTFGTAQTNATLGNEVQLNGLDADGEAVQIRCRIVGVTSTTIVTVIPHTTVPVPMRATAISDWRMAVDEFGGLYHLEGQTVSVYGDRVVVGSALNPTAYENVYTVSNGTITLAGDTRLGKAWIGLPIQAKLKTLPINPIEDGRFSARTKNVNIVSGRVAESRSFWVGSKEPEGDDPVDGLYEPKFRNNETWDEPMALQTKAFKVRTRSTYNRDGEAFITVLEPSPVSIVEIGSSGHLYGD